MEKPKTFCGPLHIRPRFISFQTMTTEESDEFCRQVERAFFSWGSFHPLEEQCKALVTKLDEFEQETLQREIVRRLLQCDLALKFPVHPEVRKRFLKRLILSLEACGAEVDEAFYSAMSSEVVGDEGTFYKSYFHSDGSHLVALSETLDLVSGGTTGLRTWEAALALKEYLASNPGISKGRRILELGSGAGFTGISILKLSLAEHVTLTDCHSKVLDRLRHNCSGNLPESDKYNVLSLDWTEFGLEDAREIDCSVLIAADVVFDPTLVPHLAETISTCLEANIERALVACTVRIEDTVSLFLQEVRKRAMKCVRQPFAFASADVHIYSITK